MCIHATNVDECVSIQLNNLVSTRAHQVHMKPPLRHYSPSKYRIVSIFGLCLFYILGNFFFLIFSLVPLRYMYIYMYLPLFWSRDRLCHGVKVSQWSVLHLFTLQMEANGCWKLVELDSSSEEAVAEPCAFAWRVCVGRKKKT